MKYNRIPKTDLNVSVLALGTWVFGGDMWSGSLDKDCLEAVDAAIDNGINFIDTAPVYGNGRSEELVGKAIKGKREKVIIATKCGLISNGKRIHLTLAPESIRKEIDDSLRRLQIEYIDLYQCHWPDSKVPVEKTLAELKKIQAAGKIRHIGLSNYDLNQLTEAVGFADIVSLQSQFSMLEHSLQKEVLPYCEKNKIGFLAYGPMAGGILTGKYQAPKKFAGSDAREFFYKYYEGENFKKVSQLLEKLKGMNHPLNQLAINWARQQKGGTSILVGCRNPEQVKQNVAAADWELTADELAIIKDQLSSLLS